MKFKFYIEARNTKAFKTENCVNNIYLLEAYMLAHNIFKFQNGIDVNGIAYVHHAVHAGLRRNYNKFECGKPGGVIQGLCENNVRAKNNINPQNQFGNVYDQKIFLTLIVDVNDQQFDDSELDYSDIKKLLLCARLAGGSITDATVSEFDGKIHHGWFVIDRSNIIKRYGRYNGLIKINTGEAQSAEKDELNLEHNPSFSVTNLGYHVIAPNKIVPDNNTMHCHETLLGAVEMVHFTKEKINNCFWKWNNIDNFFLLTQNKRGIT